MWQYCICFSIFCIQFSLFGMYHTECGLEMVDSKWELTIVCFCLMLLLIDGKNQVRAFWQSSGEQ